MRAVVELFDAYPPNDINKDKLVLFRYFPKNVTFSHFVTLILRFGIAMFIVNGKNQLNVQKKQKHFEN